MKRALFFLIVIWILLAFFNVFYNSFKSISEVKNWAFLSDSEKRHKIFGDSYDFPMLINDYTEKNANILFFSNDEMVFYYSRYSLYPRLLTRITDEEKMREIIKKGNFKYIALYDKNLKLNNYIKVASFSSKISSHYGSIYKLK